MAQQCVDVLEAFPALRDGCIAFEEEAAGLSARLETALVTAQAGTALPAECDHALSTRQRQVERAVEDVKRALLARAREAKQTAPH